MFSVKYNVVEEVDRIFFEGLVCLVEWKAQISLFWIYFLLLPWKLIQRVSQLFQNVSSFNASQFVVPKYFLGSVHRIIMIRTYWEWHPICFFFKKMSFISGLLVIDSSFRQPEGPLCFIILVRQDEGKQLQNQRGWHKPATAKLMLMLFNNAKQTNCISIILCFSIPFCCPVFLQLVSDLLNASIYWASMKFWWAREGTTTFTGYSN